MVVARTGSFTAAAAELGYTQSAVSQQIQSLEQQVGRALLERRPVRPTAAGARLIEHAHRILMRVDVARTELENIGGDGQMLRVSACPLALPAQLATALRMIRRDSPAIRISVRSATSDGAIDALAAGEVDVAVVDGMTVPETPLALSEPGLLLSTGLIEQPLLVVLPATHPMAHRKWVDMGMLADAPWVANMQEPTDLTLLLSLVAADHGSALVPASVPMLPAGVATVPLRNPDLVHRTEVLTLRDPPPVTTALVDNLKALVRG